MFSQSLHKSWNLSHQKTIINGIPAKGRSETAFFRVKSPLQNRKRVSLRKCFQDMIRDSIWIKKGKFCPD